VESEVSVREARTTNINDRVCFVCLGTGPTGLRREVAAPLVSKGVANSAKADLQSVVLRPGPTPAGLVEKVGASGSRKA
jgi:hypothetical protein